jgi:hypothetical protein
MSTMKKLSALLGAGLLVFALAAPVAAATPASEQGVTPTTVDPGNITIEGKGKPDSADCAVADALETGNSGGSDTTDNGVTVTWTFDGDTNEFAFEASGGLVTIAYVKGGNGYNEYNYLDDLGHGVADDSNMFPPDTNGDGKPQGLSHAIFCTEGSNETNPPTGAPSEDVGEITESPTDGLLGSGTSSPADGAWLLVVALGALLASVVVLTPARAKGRR